MGNGESKPNSLEQIKNHILNHIEQEIESTTSNLLKYPSFTVIFATHQQHAIELKAKIIAFYKANEITNRATATIISKNLYRQAAVDCCRSEIYQFENENQNLKEKYSCMENTLEGLRKINVNNEINLRAHRDKCEKYAKLIEDLKEAVHLRDEAISKHTEDFDKKIYELNKYKRLVNQSRQEKDSEKNLRKTTEKKVDSLLKEIETLRFQVEQQNSKVNESDKLIQNLNHELEFKSSVYANKLWSCKLEINQLTDKLNKTKDNSNMEKMREANEHKLLIEEQTVDIKNLQDKLKLCHGSLAVEIKAKEEEMAKVELIREYCDQLKNELEENKMKEKVKYEEETTSLTEQLRFVKQCYDDLKKEFDMKQTEQENTQKVLHRNTQEINRLTNLNKRKQATLARTRDSYGKEKKLREEAYVKTMLLEKQISEQKRRNDQVDTTEKDELKTLRQRCCHLEKVMEIKEAEKRKYETEAKAIKVDLLKLQDDREQETILRDNIEKHVLMLEKRVKNLKKSEEKYRELYYEVCDDHSLLEMYMEGERGE